MFYFCPSKNPSHVMENNLISSLYILEKNFLVNKYKKQTCYKKNKSLFFDFMKNGPIFRSKFVIFSMIPNSFLIEEWETLEDARRYVCNLLNLDCQDSICFAFFKLFKNEESFGNSFSFPFS